jgi:hypothetical protein
LIPVRTVIEPRNFDLRLQPIVVPPSRCGSGEVEEIIAQSEKRRGVANATALSQVLGNEVENSRESAEVIVSPQYEI